MGRWWRAEGGRGRCLLCPRECLLGEGQAGYCKVRVAGDGGIHCLVHGMHSGLSADPIEKKPLYHVLPGSRILSYGTAGCNLGCDFCQNWTMSRADPAGARLFSSSAPEIVAAAQRTGCAAVAFTYNEPVISAEWCLEVAQAARDAGLLAVAVSSAYIAPAAWADFFGSLDAVNLDLKGFTEAFYRRRCKARLAPVLEAIPAAKAAGCWVEITTLLIPGENDGDAELRDLSRWVQKSMGPETPLHFTAFHPDYQLTERPPTPLATLRRAREIALGEGLQHVYTGNLRDPEGSATRCTGCGARLIARDGFRVTALHLADGACPDCGRELAGRFRLAAPIH